MLVQGDVPHPQINLWFCSEMMVCFKYVQSIYIYIHCAYMFVYIYTVTTFKYVEGGPDREAPEVV